MATITYNSNQFGNIALADGSFVRLIQQAYNDNLASGAAGWIARGYLSTENEADETGPTVTVTWTSLGAENAEDDADWSNPESINHYTLGELTTA
jgi:hypothetical protein